MSNGQILRLPVKASNESLPAGISVVSTNTVTHTMYRPGGQQYSFYKPGDVWQPFYNARQKLEQQGDHWNFTNSNGTQEVYDAQGLLLSRTPLGGLPTTYAYDVEGRLATITGPHGRILILGYDAEGRLSSLDTPDGQIQYAYEDTAHPQNLTKVTYPDGSSRQYLYEEASFPGNLTGIVDENGNRYATWDYDDSTGKVILSEHAGGAERVEFTYNADGTTTVTETIGTDPDNPIQAVRTYHFDVVAGQLRTTRIEGDRCSDCANRDMKTREYESDGQLKRVTDWNGNITEYTYNSRQLRETVTEAAGEAEMRRSRYEYHPDFPKPTRITRYKVGGNPEVEEPLQVTLMTYSAKGQLASRTLCDPGADGICDSSDPQRTTTWTYNDQGLVIREDGSRTDVADITTYEYDSQGNRSKITNTLGQITHITRHDGAGRPLELVDPNGAATHLRYDIRGRLISSDTAGAVTTMQYDAAGNLVHIIQPDGSSLTYRYDAAHRLIAVEDALGNHIEYTLDTAGNRIREAVKDQDGQLHRSQQRLFGKLNQLQAIIGADGQQTRYTYDANGNTTRTEDANGHATSQQFDAFDALLQTTDALDGVTTYRHDALGNLIEVSTPNGAMTTYQYDGLGNRRSEQSADRGLIQYEYDAAGNRIRMTDPRGTVLHYEYDALNRLTAITTPDAALNVYFHYDQGINGIGRLSGMEDESGNTDYAYDARGNLIQVNIQYAAGGQAAWAYQYDLADQLSGIVYPGGMELHYSRDAAGKIRRISLTLDGRTTVLADNITHEPFGPVSAWDYGNGLPHQRHHDLDGRLVQLVQGGALDREYTFDAVGNVRAILAGANAQSNQDFSYDALDRLDLAIGPFGSQDYDHDPNGNRLHLTQDGVTGDYDYLAQSNRLLQGEQWRYERDASGNTATRLDAGGTGMVFHYNAHNRLSDVLSRTPGTADTTLARYRYNGRGERLTKEVAGVIRHFHYGPQGELQGELDTNGNLLRAYLYLGSLPLAVVEPQARQLHQACGQDQANLQNLQLSQLEALYCGAEAIHTTNLILQPPATLILSAPQITLGPGTRLGQGAVLHIRSEDPVTPLQSNSGLYYLHPDHLGTPRAVSDESRNIIWRWASDPFGNGLPEEDPDGDGSAFSLALRFPGQYDDRKTGLYYNYFRYYDPETGRYITSDPIGLSGGLNSYTYANLNPLRYTDPTGESAMTDALPIAGGFAAGDGPLPIGDIIAGGIIIGAAIYDMCTERDEEREKRCEENLERDLETCRVLGKRGGKAAYRLCEQQAMLRYSNCLSGRDDGIDAPLPPWGDTY